MAAGFERSPLGLRLSYQVDGASALKLNEICEPKRSDGLWRTTCFEAFVGIGEGCYLEFNFSPCADWAAYRFDHYRDGMRELDVSPPVINAVLGGASLRLEASIALSDIMPTQLGLSAVIEETDGTKSYWAPHHPSAEKPDFHDPAGWTLRL